MRNDFKILMMQSICHAKDYEVLSYASRVFSEMEVLIDDLKADFELRDSIRVDSREIVRTSMLLSSWERIIYGEQWYTSMFEEMRTGKRISPDEKLYNMLMELYHERDCVRVIFEIRYIICLAFSDVSLYNVRLSYFEKDNVFFIRNILKNELKSIPDSEEKWCKLYHNTEDSCINYQDYIEHSLLPRMLKEAAYPLQKPILSSLNNLLRDYDEEIWVADYARIYKSTVFAMANPLNVEHLESCLVCYTDRVFVYALLYINSILYQESHIQKIYLEKLNEYKECIYFKRVIDVLETNIRNGIIDIEHVELLENMTYLELELATSFPKLIKHDDTEEINQDVPRLVKNPCFNDNHIFRLKEKSSPWFEQQDNFEYYFGADVKKPESIKPLIWKKGFAKHLRYFLQLYCGGEFRMGRIEIVKKIKEWTAISNIFRGTDGLDSLRTNGTRLKDSDREQIENCFKEVFST